MIDIQLVDKKLAAFQSELESLVQHSENQLQKPTKMKTMYTEYLYMINEAKSLNVWAAVRRGAITSGGGSEAFLALTREVGQMNYGYRSNEHVAIKGRGNITLANKTALLLDALKSCVS